MREPDNDKRDGVRMPADENESPAETDAATPGSYYYDDSSGYEIYREDDSAEECPAEESAADSAEGQKPDV